MINKSGHTEIIHTNGYYANVILNEEVTREHVKVRDAGSQLYKFVTSWFREACDSLLNKIEIKQNKSEQN